MSAKKQSSALTSIGSDLSRVDSHEISQDEYSELPELTTKTLKTGVWREDGKPVKRGRPPVAMPKKQVTIRLPADVLERWKATGPGWQTRMAERLRNVKKTS